MPLAGVSRDAMPCRPTSSETVKKIDETENEEEKEEGTNIALVVDAVNNTRTQILGSEAKRRPEWPMKGEGIREE